MTKIKQAPQPGEWISGKSLTSYEDDYGADLPAYAKAILSAALCLGGMQVHERDDLTQEAAQCVIHHARELLDDAERLLPKVPESGKEDPEIETYKLGAIDVRDVPDELVHLRAIADCIYNAGVGKDDQALARWLIEFVEADLKMAKEVLAREKEAKIG